MLFRSVCAAGMLMVIGNIFGGQTITDYRAGFSIPDALTTYVNSEQKRLQVDFLILEQIFYINL